MKPNFALSLSLDGIALLHRAAGGWRRVGTVPLEVADLGASLAGLRGRALALEPGGLRTKLIIPNDQIRYMTVETGAAGGDARTEAVRRALGAATPYRLDELAFDISIDGTMTHVAAVARETLAEAEAFALDHRFNPIGFVAVPGDQDFLGEPFFGPTRHAAALPDGRNVEADGIAVVVIGDAEIPAPDAAAAPPAPAGNAPQVPAPQFRAQDRPRRHGAPYPAQPAADPAPAATQPAADPAPATTQAAPIAGFASRRGRPLAEDGPNGGAMVAEPAVHAPAVGAAPGRAPDPAAMPGPAAGLAPPLRADSGPPARAIAPAIDIPEFRSPATGTGEAKPQRAGFAGLLGRRKAVATAQPAPAVPVPARRGSPASPRIEDLPADDETARMTVFGARAAVASRGKPRHLGLILTLALLLFLAGVAAWASLFLDDGLAGLFRRSGADRDIAAVVPGVPARQAPAVAPDARPAAPGTPTTLASLSPAMLPAPEMVPRLAPAAEDAPEPAGTDQPSPGLTDTDSAVLDALRDAAGPPDGDAAAAAAAPEARTDGAFYAATGIWQFPPEVPEAPAIIGLDDLYLVSIDRTDLAQDAIALPPAASFGTDVAPVSVTSPAAAETVFDLDPGGLVIPTAAGTVSPEGITVYRGRPPVVPPSTPARFEPPSETDAVRQRLAGLPPRLRPADLAERRERAQLGGLSREELGGVRPRARPESLGTTIEETEPGPTTEAIVASVAPRMRPKDFRPPAAQPSRLSPAPESEAADDGEPDPAPATTSPAIPSSASVARQATLSNAINLSNLNLIGVYGTPSNRRALVRLPSGRYKKVKVGDTVDGGKVVAIGDSELRYQKGGRNLTLKIPSG